MHTGRVVIALTILLCVCVTFSNAAEVHIQAAASLTDCLTEIGALYEKNERDKITFNFAASSVLARQIQEGAPADIFFSADEVKMDQLEKKSLIRKDTRLSLLSNTLSIVIPADSNLKFTSANDLVTIKGNIAIAEPQSVPAGIYAKEYLKKIKIWNKIIDRLIPTENVRAALATVESGNAEAGIVYRTDTKISKHVKVAFEIPQQDGPKISYPIAILTETKNFTATKKVYDFLIGQEAKKIYQKYDFLLFP